MLRMCALCSIPQKQSVQPTGQRLNPSFPVTDSTRWSTSHLCVAPLSTTPRCQQQLVQAANQCVQQQDIKALVRQEAGIAVARVGRGGEREGGGRGRGVGGEGAWSGGGEKIDSDLEISWHSVVRDYTHPWSFSAS